MHIVSKTFFCHSMRRWNHPPVPLVECVRSTAAVVFDDILCCLNPMVCSLHPHFYSPCMCFFPIWPSFFETWKRRRITEDNNVYFKMIQDVLLLVPLKKSKKHSSSKDIITRFAMFQCVVVLLCLGRPGRLWKQWRKNSGETNPQGAKDDAQKIDYIARKN